MCDFHIRCSSKTTTRKTISLACSIERLFIFIEISRADRFCHGRKRNNSDFIKLRYIDITVKFGKSKKHIVLFSYSARIFDCYNGKQVWVWKPFSFPKWSEEAWNLRAVGDLSRFPCFLCRLLESWTDVKSCNWVCLLFCVISWQGVRKLISLFNQVMVVCI